MMGIAESLEVCYLASGVQSLSTGVQPCLAYLYFYIVARRLMILSYQDDKVEPFARCQSHHSPPSSTLKGFLGLRSGVYTRSRRLLWQFSDACCLTWVSLLILLQG